MSPDQLRLQTALAALERNRAAIRARFIPDKEAIDEGSCQTFPRSATFRWLLAALTNRQLLAAALQVVLGKHPFARTLAAWAMSRSSR